MTIAQNVAKIKMEIAEAALRAGRDPTQISLLAATKQQPPEKIREAIAAGIDIVGENRVQEMLDKSEAYAGAHLHFIGHLQTNKVKDVVGKAELIHSIDSFRIAEAVSKQALRLGIVQEVLLEVNAGEESSKSGFLLEKLHESYEKVCENKGISVRGLMCIPPVSQEKGENKKYFYEMSNILVDINRIIVDNRSITKIDSVLSVLSMGMSGDYLEAVECGSTIIRVGSGIFGQR